MTYLFILLHMLSTDSTSTNCQNNYLPCIYDLTYYAPVSKIDPRTTYYLRRKRIYFSPHTFVDTFYLAEGIHSEKIVNVSPWDPSYLISRYSRDSIKWGFIRYQQFFRIGSQTYQIDYISDDTIKSYSFQEADSFILFAGHFPHPKTYDSLIKMSYVHHPIHNFRRWPPFVDHYIVQERSITGPTDGFFNPETFKVGLAKSILKEPPLGEWIESYHYIHGAYSFRIYSRHPTTTHYTIDSTGDCHCVWESFRRGK